MLDALDEKQSARMDDSAATWNRVHAKQLAAVDTAGRRRAAARLEPEWSDAGRQRVRDARPKNPRRGARWAATSGTLHPRHNAQHGRRRR